MPYPQLASQNNNWFLVFTVILCCCWFCVWKFISCESGPCCRVST